jgi:hypothetical protein
LIDCSLSDAHYPSIVQAVHAANDVAFEWMCRSGSTVAIQVLHDQEVLVRHLLPERPALARSPCDCGTAEPTHRRRSIGDDP